MKKKLLVFCAVVMAIMCLFAISASAAEVINGITYDLNGNGTARLTNANQQCGLDVVIIPEKVTGANGTEYTVTEIYEKAFQNNKSIRYVSLPKTITRINSAAFNGCTNLVFIDFNDNQNEVWMQGWGTFRDCSSLKAVCLPDNMKIIGDQAFTNCKALTAVYLPANLEIIKGNKSDGPAFGGQNSGNVCKELFFTSEKFEVRDEKGNFYTAEAFPVPKKPEIYYFPSTVKAITANHNPNNNPMDENGMIVITGNYQLSDCGIQWCSSLNSVLVLPEGYIGYSDQASGSAILDENQRGDTVSYGLLPGCGTQENPITLVFMGRVDRVSFDKKDGNTKYTTYVFANKANTGFENTIIGTGYWTNNSEYGNQDEMYVVFCHANSGEGAKYKIGFKGQEGNIGYPVLTSELQEEATIHMVSPANNQVASQPDCITDMLVNTFCFCGKAIGANVEITGTMLGHEFDLLKGAIEHSIAYENYLADGSLYIKCARCSELHGTTAKPVISSFKGYSTKIKSDAITIGYTFDYDALAEYERVNKKSLEFGFVFEIKAYLGDNAPLDESGEALANGNIVKVTVDANASTSFDFRISGDWDSTVNINGSDIQLKDVELFLCGYIFDGSVNYLQKSGSTTDASKIIQIAYNTVA